MRVALHAGQLIQPVPGGIGRYVRALLRYLPAEGVEPVAFAAGARPEGVEPSTPWVDLGRPGPRWRYEAWHRFGRPRLRLRLATDLVHAPSLAVPPVRGRPLVVTVHDIAFVRMPEATTRHGVAFHRRALERVRRVADLILAPSEFTRRELLTQGFAPESIEVVHLGTEPPRALADEQVDALVAATGIERPYVLTVGTVEPRKGLPVLAQAVATVRRTRPELTMVVVGPSGWGAVRGLDRPGIRRLGRVPWDALDALYRRAAVCCVPSTYEGFGLPALEALARGCPVVASRGTVFDEVVGDAGLLVAPSDADALADAITELLDDDDRRAVLVARGRRRAAELSWSACAAGHAAAYRRVLSRRG